LLDEFRVQLSFLFWLNLHVAKNIARTLMTPIAEALKREHPDKKEYLQNELKSLGIEVVEPDHLHNEFNDKEEE
jgi:hypothetical protein